MAEAVVLGILSFITLAGVVAILWLFIVRWDVIEGLVLGNMEFWDEYQNDAQFKPADWKTRRRYVRYLKAKRSGEPLSEHELAELPTYMRSERIQRIWYGFIGVIFAAMVGAFGGFVIYVFASNVD